MRALSTILTALVLLLVGLLPMPASGKGAVMPGGNIAVGLSAGAMAQYPSRPLPPLQSMVADESFEPVFPLENGFRIATWGTVSNGRTNLTLSTNITVGDAPARILTAQDVISSLESRAMERWDARWALRGVTGIEDYSGGISGFEALDDRTISIDLKPGVDAGEIQRAFTSPALRISVQPAFSGGSGTGPFLPDQQITDPRRKTLTCALTHHAGRAYLDEVRVIAYPSVEESVLDFGRGNLDALLISSNEMQTYLGSSRSVANRVEKVGDALLVLVLNPARLVTSQERRSLIMASDVESIANVILGPRAQAAGDFLGNPAEPGDWRGRFEQARSMYSSVPERTTRLSLLVCDDPAARESAGRLGANWESLGAQVEIVEGTGALAFSSERDAILLALRLPSGGEGVLPQILALYDRNAWWETAALTLDSDSASLLRRVRSLDPSADLDALADAMVTAGLVAPIARYDILFAPGPDVSLVPDETYPGTVFWRAFSGTRSELVQWYTTPVGPGGQE